MITKDLYPDITTTYDDIQKAVNECDVVYLHSRDSAGMDNVNFDIGPKTILVKKSTKIVGVLDDPNDPKPLIKGTSGWLAIDTDPNGDPRAGIFAIATPGCVEVTNLHLDHKLPEQPGPGLSMHGSSTIAYFSGTTLPSTLRVTDCILDTAASAGISIDNTIPPDPNTTRKLDVFIHGCVIKGLNHPDEKNLVQYQPGNYVCVRLGGLIPSQRTIDMRNSVFEVSACTLDVAKFAGVAVGFSESDSNSVFVISGNTIGHHPNSGLEVTRLGVAFVDVSVASGPKGTIRIVDNKIKLQGYFSYPEPDWSAGIYVVVKNASPQQSISTTLTGNTIDFSQTVAPQWAAGAFNPAMFGLTGIVYQDEVPAGSVNATVLIANNRVLAHSPVNPSRGIWLHNAAHDVTVVANDLTGLTASHAQIALDTNAHNCIFADNQYGALGNMGNLQPEAVVLCDGDDNSFWCRNFSKQGVPGWLAGGLGGPGRLKLDKHSQRNEAHLEVPVIKPGKAPVLITYQWLDLGENNVVSTLEEKIHEWKAVMPNKPPAPRKGRPLDVHPPVGNPLIARDKGMRPIR